MFMSALLYLHPSPVLAGQGCCSSHGGADGCAGSGLLCKDGSQSPSCRCAPNGKHYHLKDDSVKADGLHTKISDGLGTVGDVWSDNHLPEPVVTSGNDNIHPGNNHPGTKCGPSDSETDCRSTSNSLHYKGKAIDLSDHGMDNEMKKAVVDELRRKLGNQYKVGIHNKGTKDEHIHIEYHGD
jgi:hypothetical protein